MFGRLRQLRVARRMMLLRAYLMRPQGMHGPQGRGQAMQGGGRQTEPMSWRNFRGSAYETRGNYGETGFENRAGLQDRGRAEQSKGQTVQSEGQAVPRGRQTEPMSWRNFRGSAYETRGNYGETSFENVRQPSETKAESSAEPKALPS